MKGPNSEMLEIRAEWKIETPKYVAFLKHVFFTTLPTVRPENRDKMKKQRQNENPKATKIALHLSNVYWCRNRRPAMQSMWRLLLSFPTHDFFF